MRTVLAVVAFGMGACTLLTDLGDFSTVGNGALDATTDTAPPTVGDDGSVLPPGDGGVTIDAGGDAGAGFQCVPGAHAFCTDFEGNAPLSGWLQHLDTPATIALDTLLTHSPTHAVRATNPRQASGTKRYATIARRFTGWKRIAVDFEVYVVKPAFLPSDSNAGVFGIDFQSDGSAQALAVSVSEIDTVVGRTHAGSYIGGTSAAVMTFDAWVHGHFDVTPGGNITATIGDRKFQSSFPSISPGANAEIEIALGVHGYNAPSPLFDVLVDDVVVDFP